jgi:class 3 adenylate cyclase
MVSEALAIAQETGANALLDRALALKLRIQGVDKGNLLTSIDRVAISAQSEHPPLAPHAGADGKVTIMFSDIEGSATLADRLGDQRFMEMLREHNALVRSLLREHGGFEVKNEGDGFMVAFRSAERAIDCAVEIERALTVWSSSRPEPIKVRIGMHSGEVVEEDGDFFGRNVILAARVANQASGNEILVSRGLKELVDGADVNWGKMRTVELKGLSGIHEVWPVVWN